MYTCLCAETWCLSCVFKEQIMYTFLCDETWCLKEEIHHVLKVQCMYTSLCAETWCIKEEIYYVLKEQSLYTCLCAETWCLKEEILKMKHVYFMTTVTGYLLLLSISFATIRHYCKVFHDFVHEWNSASALT